MGVELVNKHDSDAIAGDIRAVCAKCDIEDVIKSQAVVPTDTISIWTLKAKVDNDDEWNSNLCVRPCPFL